MVTAMLIAVFVKRRSNPMPLDPPVLIPPPHPATHLGDIFFHGESHETALSDDVSYSYPIVQLSGDNALYGQSPHDIPLIKNVSYKCTHSRSHVDRH